MKEIDFTPFTITEPAQNPEIRRTDDGRATVVPLAVGSVALDMEHGGGSALAGLDSEGGGGLAGLEDEGGGSMLAGLETSQAMSGDQPER